MNAKRKSSDKGTLEYRISVVERDLSFMKKAILLCGLASMSGTEMDKSKFEHLLTVLLQLL